MQLEADSRTAVLQPDFKHLDTLNAQEFGSRFAPLAAEADTVLIDMALVHYVDSSGLGAILNLIRDTLSRGARIALCGAQPSVKVLFRMVQISKLLPVFDTREQAMDWAGREMP